MSWERQGSVTVANGSPVVTGNGTDFVSTVRPGWAFALDGGPQYEIDRIVSATELRLVRPYLGGNAAGQAYSIMPTEGEMRDLSLRAGELLNTFGAVRDGIGQGLIGDGSVAAPSLRFAADQDTGFRRYGENISSIVCGGADIAIFGPAGTSFSANAARVGQMVAAGLALDTSKGLTWAGNVNEVLIPSDGVAGWLWKTDGRILIQSSSGTAKMMLDSGGNLLLGTVSASYHRIAKSDSLSTGNPLLGIGFTSIGDVMTVYSTRGSAASGAASTIKVNSNEATGRSINAGGTINASGADYAEYMVKAESCGIIDKGDVCGVDRDGKLTKTWADAISFVVKSTDPSLVGGDTWAAHLPPRPVDPGEEPLRPVLPAAPAEGADDAEVAAYQERLAAYPSQVAQHRANHDAWAAATAAYARDLPQWEAGLEAARVCVDRIAFCGQVPCNVSGDFEVGDYIVAAASGAGIKAVAVKPDDITLPQYMRRLGKVWAVRDGRAWIDVQHG